MKLFDKFIKRKECEKINKLNLKIKELEKQLDDDLNDYKESLIYVINQHKKTFDFYKEIISFNNDTIIIIDDNEESFNFYKNFYLEYKEINIFNAKYKLKIYEKFNKNFFEIKIEKFNN
jgi:hypothetical protein